MASSNVIASRSPPNSDLPRQSSTSSLNLHSDQTRGFSMNMDEILRNIYADPTSFAVDSNAAAGEARLPVSHAGIRDVNDIKSADEVWRDIVSGGAGAVVGGSSGEPAMTLEDFLAKAGAVNEDDVRVPPPPPPPTVGAFGIETVMMNPVAGVPAAQFTASGCVQNVEFGSGMAAASGGGRGKRRVAVEEPPLDKATQQKQRRMIKNRESAARSRERKQAYTVELEALVTQLEEDNARLLKEQVEFTRERYKQLMENLIPIEGLIPDEEEQRPRRVLRMEKLIPVEEKNQRHKVLRRTRSEDAPRLQ